MTVGERIKVLREKMNITQTELANICKISKQNLYKYENNIITNIPSDKIEMIAKALCTTPAVLMGWEKESLSPSQDIDIRRIERARQNMTQQEKDEMMKVLEISFKKYFTDNFVDTTDYSDEDED